MANTFRIFVAGVIVGAFGATAIHAQDEKSPKEKPEAVKKEGEKPTKEQPAEGKSEAVKKEGEKPTKEQPATEKKPDQGDKPAEKRPEARKRTRTRAAAKEGTMVEAIVKSVDTTKNSISVMLRKNEEKVEQTFAVEKDAQFRVAGTRRASLADVKPETQVDLMLTEQKTVRGIRSTREGDGGRKGRMTNGVIKAVDTSKNEITVTIQNRREAADQTFGIAKDVRVDVADSDGKIGGLKPGTRVAIRLSEDKKTVMGIKAAAERQKAPRKKRDANR